MDIDLIFRIALAIVTIGLCVKVVKKIGNMIFKISLFILILVGFYKLFLGA